MLEMTIIISGVITLIFLKIFLNINFKNIKKLEIRRNDALEKISEKFPEDEKMCKTILEKLNNKNVKVKIEQAYNSSLYTVFNNTITIGKFKQDYMKPQTIAHECIHSCQNKKTLWFNFIISNIYIIYFAVILILGVLNKLPNTEVHGIILIFLSLIQYIIRYSLESEAMIKAKYIAKEYIEENKILNKVEKEQLLEEYDKINEIGIPFMHYYTISMNIVKIMLYSFITIV